MHIQLLKIVLTSLLALVLSACGGGNGDNGGGDNQLSSIASQAANTDSVPINDPDALVSDIEALFGGPNDEPVQIGDNESLVDALNRLP